MKLVRLPFLLLACLLALAPVVGHAASREELDAKVREAVETLYKTSSAAKELAGHASGMLVFPAVYKGGIGIGGEYGEGALLQGGHNAGYFNLFSASVGFQLGAQRKSVVILFMTAEALKRFEDVKGFKVGVDGSVAIATLGTGGGIDSETAQKPVIGFIYSNQGLMYNLTLEGSKITRIHKK